MVLQSADSNTIGNKERYCIFSIVIYLFCVSFEMVERVGVECLKEGLMRRCESI